MRLRRQQFAAVVLVCALAQQFPAQEPVPTPGVIRIDVNLVQVDAVVTDAKGNPVTDLTADDFEVLQDGRSQRIRNFEFIRVRDPRALVVSRGVNAPVRGVPAPPPPTALKAEQVRRTIALVVDDIAISFDGTVRTRESLKKWVDNEMQPGDLVSIVRTNAAMGAMQQFTNDKRLLYAAIERVKYQPGRVGVESFTAFGSAFPGPMGTFGRELANSYLVGSINAVRYIMRGLRELPGRKSLILFSEDMTLSFLDPQRQAIETRLRRLADEANRSSVVIYAIDPRGVTYTGLTATDRIAGGEQDVADALGARSEAYISSQDGLVLLSQRTGGLFYSNNDLAGNLRQAIDDGDGYYLIGYQPSLGTFDPPSGASPRYHTISVRVTRPGLKVRSRSGFFGAPDSSLAPPPSQTRSGQLAKALVSPFTTPDLRVRLTTLFSHSDKEGAYLKTMLHFDARDLAFTEAPDGARTAQIDIAMVTINENGDMNDAIDKTWNLRVEKGSFEAVLKHGLVYSVPLPIKKAGPYQLRVALRDAKSKKLGSAGQFVDVPDVKSGRLALSGIVVSLEPQNPDNPEGTPAVRVFKSGGAFSYAYEILNARTNSKENPQLEMQMRLYRENEMVHQSTPIRLNTDKEKDAKRLAVGGQMQLTKIPPGEYVMQVTVFDSLKPKDKNRVATQTIDLEVRQ